MQGGATGQEAARGEAEALQADNEGVSAFLRMDKERADLWSGTSDRETTRRRYNAKTEEGITSASS